ncbi:hypothetical protein VI817_002972 [Penicillium citrinum]|nr:hypothetical protein VI817_002972 [Penicillium citrinum]
MAVPSEAKNVWIETPDAVRPWPPVCSKAFSRPEVMMIGEEWDFRLEKLCQVLANTQRDS